MEVIGQLHAPAVLPRRNKISVITGQEAAGGGGAGRYGEEKDLMTRIFNRVTNPALL
jgi:hypothetical protein